MLCFMYSITLICLCYIILFSCEYEYMDIIFNINQKMQYFLYTIVLA